MWRKSLSSSVLALSCITACSGASPEPVPEESTAAAPRTEHVIELTDDLRSRVTFTTTEVVRLATEAPIAATATIGVDEHHFAIVDAPAPGRVLALLAHVGDEVAPGDALAELASGEVGGMRARVTEAEAHVATLEARLERRRALSGAQLGTTGDVEDAERELATAREELTQARAGLTAADVHGGSRTTLIVSSQIAGTILAHHAFPGESAAQDNALFEIGDLRTLWLLVHVSEGDATRLHVGDIARVSFPSRPDSLPRELPIALVGPRVEADTLSVEVRCDVPNDDLALRPGMVASVIFTPPGAGETLVVPSGAVQHTNAGWTVFVPHGDHAMEARVVARGRDLGGEVEIVSGLEAGERVVLEGAFVLRAISDSSDWSENG